MINPFTTPSLGFEVWCFWRKIKSIWQ